ncbi:MAG: pyruvate dehydrogenase complex E1 component subunit beta [Pseudomonadota bacterium]|nr:pyruvate dehydrogenase complex E1 component subunit beta [Pseudomonadota bacterium]
MTVPTQATKISIREALRQAMCEEMRRDADIFLLGEEVAEYDGAYKVSKGMLKEFGARRVVDAPISEAGFAGLGIGAAMAGLRPIIEMMTWNFGIQAFDQIINHAAKVRYMSGGQFKVPLVLRGPNGVAHMLGATHSQYIEPFLAHVPGLVVVAVSTPYDAKGLLKAAIRDDNPVIFLESEFMYGDTGEVPDAEYLLPLGKGMVVREGTDATVVAWGKMLKLVLRAADVLGDDVSLEIINPMTLQPLDTQLLVASVNKTHRLLVVEEAPAFAAIGAEIAAQIQERCFDELDAPVARVSAKHLPVPYADHLERATLPSVEEVVAAVRQLLYMDTQA